MAKFQLDIRILFSGPLLGKTTWINDQERNLEIVQLDIFKWAGGCLQKMEKSPKGLEKTLIWSIKIYSDDTKNLSHVQNKTLLITGGNWLLWNAVLNAF